LQKKTFDLYCTGSNARLLSSEIATGLSGRYIEIPVHALSYQEFLRFQGLSSSEDSLLKYIRYGGLPFITNLKLTDEIVYGYLRSVYNTIILKDVVARFIERRISNATIRTKKEVVRIAGCNRVKEAETQRDYRFPRTGRPSTQLEYQGDRWPRRS